jgi:site-specific DNA-methyltransferase (adenine-specific)
MPLRQHENIYIFKDKQGTYNPQKTEREKDYKHSGKRSSEEHYGNILNCKKEYKKEDGKFPSSIIEYKNPQKPIHRTQKPVDLLEWLIKTYSNENDIVMDFCMGSGTAGVACQNLNRKFIGVEMDKEIYDKAYNRIKKK